MAQGLSTPVPPYPYTHLTLKTTLHTLLRQPDDVALHYSGVAHWASL